MHQSKLERRIGLLDWSILLSLLLLLLIIYIPSSIWAEEKKDRNESRFRMKAIANAAEFYKELMGGYSKDGNEIFALVEAAIDDFRIEVFIDDDCPLGDFNQDTIINVLDIIFMVNDYSFQIKQKCTMILKCVIKTD